MEQYIVKLTGNLLKEDKGIYVEIGTFNSFDKAVSKCRELNNTLRDIGLIKYGIAEWRFDIEKDNKLYAIIDMDINEIEYIKE